MENPEKMTPIQMPDAPRLSAYMGSRGTMIPTPSIDEKMERKRTTKTFLFKGVLPCATSECKRTTFATSSQRFFSGYHRPPLRYYKRTQTSRGEIRLVTISWYND